MAFALLMIAIGIDSADGILARKCQTGKFAKRIDGVLLDNIIDFLTYTIVPAFILMVGDILPEGPGRTWIVAFLVLSSAYQFCQIDAKTKDHFFKGFPSYWGLVVFYLTLWPSNIWLNAGIVLSLSILSFVPVKFVYPSRLDYLSQYSSVRNGFIAATIIWGLATVSMLFFYPDVPNFLYGIVALYTVLYTSMSLYKTATS